MYHVKPGGWPLTSETLARGLELTIGGSWGDTDGERDSILSTGGVGDGDGERGGWRRRPVRDEPASAFASARR